VKSLALAQPRYRRACGTTSEDQRNCRCDGWQYGLVLQQLVCAFDYAEVAGCTFKDCQVRLATPRELYKCRMFQITTISSSWETAAHVYPKVE